MGRPFKKLENQDGQVLAASLDTELGKIHSASLHSSSMRANPSNIQKGYLVKIFRECGGGA